MQSSSRPVPGPFQSQERSIALIAAGIIACLASARAVYILMGGMNRILQNVPDDAIYYVDLAKQFLATGHWTFDGVEPTTGFHLLWAYMLALYYRCYPTAGLLSLYLLSSFIGVISLLVCTYLLSRLVVHAYGLPAVLPVIILFCGLGSLQLPTMAMETPLVFLFSGFAIYFVARPESLGGSIGSVGLPFLCGLLGMLSRSDFGVLAFALLCASYVSNKSHAKASKLVALSLFAGALSGLVIVTAHTWLVSGNFLQGSAAVKAYWSHVGGQQFRVPLHLWAEVLTDFPVANTGRYAVAAMVLVIAVGGITILRRKLDRFPILAGVFIIGEYIILYRLNSEALQAWYLAYFLPASVLALAPAFSLLSGYGAAAMAGFAALWAAGNFWFSLQSPWPQMDAMRTAGIFLREHPDINPVGSWNSGLFAYYAKRPVVNLDGLVNDRAAPYIVSQRLAAYVRKRQLNYILDFQVMFFPNFARRGGYEDGILAMFVKPLQHIGPDDKGAEWLDTRLTLYRVDQKCLARQLNGNGPHRKRNLEPL